MPAARHVSLAIAFLAKSGIYQGDGDDHKWQASIGGARVDRKPGGIGAEHYRGNGIHAQEAVLAVSTRFT